jgi:hypothetical protein
MELQIYNFCYFSISSKIAPSIIHSIPYLLKSTLTMAMLYLYPVKGFHKTFAGCVCIPSFYYWLVCILLCKVLFFTKYLLHGRWPQNEGHIVSSSQLQEKAYFQRKINQLQPKSRLQVFGKFITRSSKYSVIELAIRLFVSGIESYAYDCWATITCSPKTLPK